MFPMFSRRADGMHKNMRYIQAIVVLGFLVVFVARTDCAQEFLPSPPADRALIYVLDDQNKLVPLAFEQATTPLHSDQVAKGTKVSYIELKGEHSATTLMTAPRLFLFTSSRQGTHPPFLVWLSPPGRARRLTALPQKGMQGCAIASQAIIKPSRRLLSRLPDDHSSLLSTPPTTLI